MLTAVQLYSLIGFVNGVVALALSIYFLRQHFNPLCKGFGFFCLSICLWSLCYSAWLLQTDENMALIWIRVAMGFCYFIPSSFLWFSKTIVGENPGHSKGKFFYWITPAFIGALNSSPLIIEKVEPRLFFPYWPVPGLGMYFVCSVFNFVVIYSLFLIAKYLRHAEGFKKKQLSVIFTGVLLVWLGGSTNWLLWYNIPFAPLPNFFVGLCLCLIFYGVVCERLFDIEQIAEIAREMKLSTLGLMTASINHELRNPLFIAKGRIDAHLDSVERNRLVGAYQEIEKSRETLAAVAVQIDRAFGIMQKLSEIVRMQKHDLPQESQNLNHIIQNVLKLVAYEIDCKTIKIDCLVSKEIFIYSNLLQAEEIFLNLFANAIQSIKNEGSLTISAFIEGNKTIVQIVDDGSGISKENLKKIFDPFYSTKGEKGTGLGLYITKQLIERNGGKISVESKVGIGTTFVLEFRKGTPLAPPSVELPWLGVSVSSKGASLTSLFEKQKRGIVPKSPPLWVLGKEEFSESSPSLCVKHPNKEGNSSDSSPSLCVKHPNKEGNSSESSPSLCVKHPNKEGNSSDSSPSLYAKHTNKEGLGEFKK